MTFEHVPTLPIATSGKTGPADPGSSLSERLLRAMRLHVEEEDESVRAYKSVAAATDDLAVRLLLKARGMESVAARGEVPATPAEEFFRDREIEAGRTPEFLPDKSS